MKFSADIHVPQRIQPADYCGLSRFWVKCVDNSWMDRHHCLSLISRQYFGLWANAWLKTDANMLNKEKAFSYISCVIEFVPLVTVPSIYIVGFIMAHLFCFTAPDCGFHLPCRPVPARWEQMSAPRTQGLVCVRSLSIPSPYFLVLPSGCAWLTNMQRAFILDYPNRLSFKHYTAADHRGCDHCSILDPFSCTYNWL